MKGSLDSDDLDAATVEQANVVCPNCASGDIYPTEVRSAFWHLDRLVVIEDIPALVCNGCHEQFYDDSTVTILDLIRGEGFPAEKARREITVPVFSFNDRIPGVDEDKEDEGVIR